MKIFANKSIFNKIVIIFIVIMAVSFIVPKVASAGIGGELMTPIMSLFVGLADGINTLIQKFFLHQEPTILVVSEGIEWFKVIIGALIGIGVAAVGIVTGAWIPIVIGAAWTLTVIYTTATGGTKVNSNLVLQTITSFSAEMLSGDELQLPLIQMSPYEIFSNKGDIFSVNIFKSEKEQESSEKTIISTLKNIVRDWYKTLRLIAIVGMMSVLVYIGIRILISSTADSKAKYKQMLWDWLMATCLIFVMHYIMVFSNMVVDSITEIVDSISVETKVGDTELVKNEQGVEGFLFGTKTGEDGKTPEIDSNSQKLIGKAYKIMITNGNDTTKNYKSYFWSDLKGTQAKDENSAKVLFWPAGNFMSQARIYAQKANTDGKSEDYSYIGFGLIYVVLTIYTVTFIFVYIRRLIYMIFLTLIAPLVALTYPIDKVKDGQAQAFNFWFKEYTFNLLMQPLHLLLYMILIGSAMKFAANNSLYVIVALGFMVPAEKLLKEMFGFKGTTPGSMPGLAAGALVMSATRSLFGKAPKSNNSLGNGSGKGSEGNMQAPNKIESAKPWGNNELFPNNGNGSGNNNGGNTENTNNQTEPEIIDPTAAGSLDLAQDSENMMPNPNSVANRTLSGNSSDSQQTDTDNSEQATIENNAVPPTSGNNGAETNDNNSLSRREKLKKIGRATGSVIKNRGMDAWDKARSKENWKNIGKNALKDVTRAVPRVALGAGLGTFGATAGAISGIVSGDLSKGIQNSAALGFAGAKLGSNMGRNTGDNLISAAGDFMDDVKNEYYAGNATGYNQKLMDEYEKNWKNDRNNMGIIKRNIDKDKYEDLVNDGIGKYLQYGFTDAKDIVAAEKFAEDNKLSRDAAINVLQMNKQIAGGNFTNLHENDKQKWRDDMKKRFGKYSSDQNTIADNVKKAEGYLESLSSIRSKIQ